VLHNTNMKLLSRITLTTVLLGTATAIATDVGPKRTDFSRYQAMLDHSPFAVATAATLPAATPSFAPNDLYIADVVHSPEGDRITLRSVSDKNFEEVVSTRGPNKHGYSIKDFKFQIDKCPH
jgi:hypothetical protein